jgi:hypothetical protein
MKPNIFHTHDVVTFSVYYYYTRGCQPFWVRACRRISEFKTGNICFFFKKKGGGIKRCKHFSMLFNPVSNKLQGISTDQTPSPSVVYIKVLTGTQKHFHGQFGACGHMVGNPCTRHFRNYCDLLFELYPSSLCSANTFRGMALPSSSGLSRQSTMFIKQHTHINSLGYFHRHINWYTVLKSCISYMKEKSTKTFHFNNYNKIACYQRNQVL